MPKELRRNKAINMYVTEQEREVVNRLARQLNFSSTSSFLRELVLDLRERLAQQSDNTPSLL